MKRYAGPRLIKDFDHPSTAEYARYLYDQGRYAPNPYDVLGVSQRASTAGIRAAFHAGAWGLAWEPGPGEDTDFAETLRERACSALVDPATRWCFASEIAQDRDFAARQITEKSPWGTTWATLIGLLAFFMIMDGDNAARWIGTHYAPNFAEVRTYHPGLDDGEGEAFTSRFESSSDDWERLMNNGLIIRLVPAIALAIIAGGGKYGLDAYAGRAVLWLQRSGRSQTFLRRALWAFVIVVPLLLFVYIASFGLGAVDYTTVMD